jgi:prophage antirepressor-like protein
MNKIQEFFNEHFGRVRTISIDDVTYFFGIDIAKALGYSNESKAISTHCKKIKKETLETSNSQNGRMVKSKVLLIQKSDIYRLIVKSKLETADEFEKWIFDEILPTIEKTGAYIEEGREQEMVNYYFSNLSPDLQGQIVNELMEKNKELQQFYDDLMNTDGLYSMNVTAKELKIGRNTLFAYLRGKDIMFYKDNSNIPYQRFMNQGLFEVIESPCADGQYRPTTYATKKGLEYIRKLLRKDGYYAEVA